MQHLTSYYRPILPRQQPQQPPLNFPHHTQQSNQPVNQAIQSNAAPTAKWHIPQSAQQHANGGLNNQGMQSSLAMQFGNSNGGMPRSYKIALKSPSTLKQTSALNGNQNSAGAGAAVEIPSTVTSTNPKTPSPSTNDVSGHIEMFENSEIHFIDCYYIFIWHCAEFQRFRRIEQH